VIETTTNGLSMPAVTHSRLGAISVAEQLMPHAARGAPPASDHVVQFYETDEFLIHTLGSFITTGLSAGDACIVVATPAHRAGLDERLQAAGLDVSAARASGQYVALDAAETLATFMVDGSPEPRRFVKVLGDIITRATQATGQPHVCIFGEMVALLWTAGNYDAALRLEDLWNALQELHAFSLYCAYPLHGFDGEAFAKPLSDVCAIHARVIPAESYTALDDTDDRLRNIVLLQQKARLLQAEIAERKATEQRLRRREQELSDFFENATIALHWVGPDGRVLRVNRAELEMLGYTRDEYLGHHISEFHADREVINDILVRLSCGEELHDYEARLRCKNGAIRHVLISSNVHWEDGKFRHTRCVTKDITERKQAEEERERLLARERAARVEAQEAVRMRDVFISVAAHELKTPLTSLMGQAQLLNRRALRDDIMSERELRSINVISAQASRLNKMILALLDVSRLETGQLSIERAPLDLRAVAQRVVVEVQPALERHTVTYYGPEEPVIVTGDEIRLDQVLQNLVQNAIKYSPKGGDITVQVTRDETLARVAISDQGIGIPQQDFPKLFGRFYRAESVETEHIGGMGIGLFVVKEIVSMHGGVVEVESHEGIGSTFTVCLPLELEHAPV